MVLGLLAIAAGCPKTAVKAEVSTQPMGKVYFSFFDTVSYIYSYRAETEQEFDKNSLAVASILSDYHRLMDINYEYSGITNLCTLNKNAGGEPLKVDEKLLEFLLYAKDLCRLTDGEMNVMLGAVLKPWHDCRSAASSDPQNASIPDMSVLEEAIMHTDIDLLEIDEEKCTVRISDPKARIDVGALGKGYATEKAALYLAEQGINGYVLNIGGNIRLIGTKADGSGWLTGIKDPQNPDESFALRITISDTSCVTSGSYERFYTVAGKRYHHVIDKDTLMPSDYFPSVTVVCPDSGLADALSTALFCMSREDGEALIRRFDDVDVLWIYPDGTLYMTEGLKKLIIK